MTPEQALREGQEKLATTGVEYARRVAELLLMHVLQCEKAGLVAVDALTPRQKQAFLRLVERACQEPRPNL